MFIINWFKKPYFFDPSPKNHLILAFGVGVFIFLFLFLFQPFGMSELEGNLFYYSLGFGFVTFFAQTIMFVIIPYIFKDFFKNEKWTIGKNVLFLFILVFFISISNWYYNNKFQNTENSRLLTFEEIFSYTFSISIFPVFIFTFFSEKFYRIKREKNSKEIMEFKVSTPIEKVKNKEIKIVGDNKKEEIIFNIENLVYITSQGNYASFFLKNNKGLEENILRNTLSNIESDLRDYSNIIRCHKSYIVNSEFMDAISGNARGYFLKSEFIEKEIPISRNFPKKNLQNLIN